MSDLAESQRNRENNDLQDLVESLVRKYLYPWLKPDISVTKRLDLGEYAILDENGKEQRGQDLNLSWEESLDQDSFSKILEQQYAILTGNGDEVPYLLYSVQHEAEQPTPVKAWTKQKSSRGVKKHLYENPRVYPDTEIYGLIDIDLSDDEKEYDILLSLLDEYIIVTQEDLTYSSNKTNSEVDLNDKCNEPKRLVMDSDSDAPWRFSGLCIEMESVVADEEDKGKMFTGFLKKYLPSYEIIDEETDSDSELLNATFNEDNDSVHVHRKITFADEDDVHSNAFNTPHGTSISGDVSEDDMGVTPLDCYPPNYLDSLDSGFFSDGLLGPVTHINRAVGSPDNQAAMLNPPPESWELPRGESMIPFWLQEEDEAQVLPTCQIFSYSKDRIKGAYKVYWVEGERVVQFTDSGDDIFQDENMSEDILKECASENGVLMKLDEDVFMTSPLFVETPSMKRRPSIRRISELYPANPFAKKLDFYDKLKDSKKGKTSTKSNTRKRNTGMQTLPSKETSDDSNPSSVQAARHWLLIDYKPLMYIFQELLTPRNALYMAVVVPCGIMGFWLSFRYLTGQI